MHLGGYEVNNLQQFTTICERDSVVSHLISTKTQINPLSALEAMLRVRQTALTDVAQRHKAHSRLRSPQSIQPSASVYFGDPIGTRLLLRV